MEKHDFHYLRTFLTLFALYFAQNAILGQVTAPASVCVGSTGTLSPTTGGTWTSNNTARATVTNTGIITGLTSGTVTFTYKLTSTGVSTTTNAVTVNARPTPAITGTTTLCSGNATVLTASGGTQYNWGTGFSTTSKIEIPILTATTTYTVTVKNAASCTATKSQVVSVNSLPIPNITGTTSIITGNTTTLTATDGTQYNWGAGYSASAAFTTPILTGNTTSTYTVTVKNATGCTATKSQTITVTDPEFNCPEATVGFLGIPQTTLCSEYPNTSNFIPIGAGTTMPSTTNGFSTVSVYTNGKFHVTGDFTVDKNIKFVNCVFFVDPGIKINVVSPDPTSITGSLVLDNTKLFSCNGLWEGIKLSQSTAISTFNNTEIEDAKVAIFADAFSYLFIDNTTFNRNKVGIELVTQFPNMYAPGPLIWQFSGNHFTCDAPLNGTTDEIGYAGVKLKNSYFYNFNGLESNFTDLQNGIYSEGEVSYINASNLRFQRIRNKGIYMEFGNIDLQKSWFENCFRHGVDIYRAQRVKISNNCHFFWDESLPENSDFLLYAIHLNNFEANSTISIIGTYFESNLSTLNRIIEGIFIAPSNNNIGIGTNILITNCNFNIISLIVDAIRIMSPASGFPEESNVVIFNNRFNIRPSHAQDASTECVSLSGTQNNLKIIENHFFNTEPNPYYFGKSYGIHFRNSQNGENNEIIDNHFDEGLQIIRANSTSSAFVCPFYGGIKISNVSNLRLCSNLISNSLRGFGFYEQNMNMDFVANKTYTTQLIYIDTLSLFSPPQINKGNEYHALLDAYIPDSYLVASIQAQNRNTDQFLIEQSRFIVNTPQTTWYNLNHQDSTHLYFRYHPRDIVPDLHDEWWRAQLDLPVPIANCPTGWLTTTTDTKTNKDIATGLFVPHRPLMAYQAARWLYYSLSKHPLDLTQLPTVYSTFYNTKSATNIGKFYQIDQALDGSHDAPLLNISASIQSVQNNLDVLLADISIKDSLGQKAKTAIEIEKYQKSRIEKLNQLSTLLLNNKGLQENYRQRVNVNLNAAEAINNTLNPDTEWEKYEQKVNTTLFDCYRTGKISTQQVQDMTYIANLCSKDAGNAVQKANSLLPTCVRNGLVDLCTSTPPALQAVTYFVNPEERKSQEGNESFISVYPNPAQDLLHLNIPSGLQGTVIIYNAIGQEMMKTTIQAPQTTLTLSPEFKNGLYFISLSLSNGIQYSTKFTISK